MKSTYFFISALALSLLFIITSTQPLLFLALLPLLCLLPFIYACLARNSNSEKLHAQHDFEMLRREAAAKLHRYKRARSSPLADLCQCKVDSLRTMAELVKKPALRQRSLEACTLSDIIIETIRRMPNDTISGQAFLQQGLTDLENTLEHHFATYRAKEHKYIEQIDLKVQSDVERCWQVITRFSRYQEDILREGSSE